jgi:hypothetical protein
MRGDLMQYGGSLERWETPLSGEGYKNYFVTQGSWQNNSFIVPIDCARDIPHKWDRWLCQIRKSIWVRVITDESHGIWMEGIKYLEGTERTPFYRIVGSSNVPMYESYLKDIGRIKAGGSLREYLIANMENEIHILGLEEPSSNKINLRLAN